ncbi:M28 family peptidase [Mollicutes bacterium LVI A0039]|nr:M28 family peptidase [Mollicutes bacterium LVI A0039]
MKEKIFTEHANRFSSKRKQNFRTALISELEAHGYEVTIHKSIRGNNIYFGNIDSKYILTAHYDTATNMTVVYPFIKYFGNRIGQVVLLLVLLGILPIFTNLLDPWLASMIFLVAALTLLIGLLIPNKYNYNDNTSGVLTLLEHAIRHKDNPNFFYALTDNEEKGLFGAYALKSYLNKRGKFQGKYNINVDCVGIGDTFALCCGKKSKYLNRSVTKCNEHTPVLSFATSLFTSDHVVFGEKGIMISKLNRAKFAKDYYIPNLHTNKDKEFDWNNIDQALKIIDKITTD